VKPDRYPTIVLKRGHVRPVHAGHPWIFAQAVERVEGGATAGDEVRVVDPQGKFLGRAFFSPKSAIIARILRHSDEPVDAAFLRARIENAALLRKTLGFPVRGAQETDAYRLVNAEGDGLPGLVVDRFGDVLAVQLGTGGMRAREGVLFDELEAVFSPRAIVDRTPAAVARTEGVGSPAVPNTIVRGDASVTELRFHERGFRYAIPLELGQKTGFYVDQRPLRARVEQLAHGHRVLDAFAFVGSFSFAAARGGASHVTAVDESAIALQTLGACAKENGLVVHALRDDARSALERASHEGGLDLVICDPPKLAPSKASKEAALGAYRRLATLGCRATKPGGLLVLCSCSGAVGVDELTRALALGARDANTSATVLERHFQGADHPVHAAFPEGLYLKSVIARVEAMT